ncbi:hypothetical protein BJP37_09415 [Moorena bouillonii PNG]|uniref:Uncharacterized protein n=1 Tax=Moorena bouillonii PNG TaxID=568701 RepID=A0A1U7MZU4_9CYAN|nr:hypothetical protein BJP37_09415 [Moorena bouillonii PNG]
MQILIQNHYTIIDFFESYKLLWVRSANAIIFCCSMKAGKIIAVYMVRLFMVQSAIVKSGFTTKFLNDSGIAT